MHGDALFLGFIRAPAPSFCAHAVWVYCGDKSGCQGNYQQCWLKHLPHPEASKPAKQGPHVPWTAGTLDVDMNANPKSEKKVGSVGSSRNIHLHLWVNTLFFNWYRP